MPIFEVILCFPIILLHVTAEEFLIIILLFYPRVNQSEKVQSFQEVSFQKGLVPLLSSKIFLNSTTWNDRAEKATAMANALFATLIICDAQHLQITHDVNICNAFRYRSTFFPLVENGELNFENEEHRSMLRYVRYH